MSPGGQMGVFPLEAFVVLEGRDVYSPLRAQHANGWLGWDGLPESFRCLALMGFGYIVHWVVHRRVGCFILRVIYSPIRIVNIIVWKWRNAILIAILWWTNYILAERDVRIELKLQGFWLLKGRPTFHCLRSCQFGRICQKRFSNGQPDSTFSIRGDPFRCIDMARKALKWYAASNVMHVFFCKHMVYTSVWILK